MSASICLGVRRQSPVDPRIAVLAILPLILALLAVGIASAELPPGVVRLSVDDAERSGSVIQLIRHAVHGSNLVGAQPPSGGMSLLAVSPDGSAVALADRMGEASGTLILAASDGSQLRISLPGLLGATYAGDGSWLAVVDGRGALWRVDATIGGSELVAEGPFIGSPLIDTDGSLVMVEVPSVEAPYRATLVRVVPGTGGSSVLSARQLVYAAFPLEAGDLAVVAHDVTGTVVGRLSAAGERPMVDLGAGAANVTVAPNGGIAFEVAGEGIFIVDPHASAPRALGNGTLPCFAPDGSSVLVSRGEQRVALGLDGSPLAEVEGLAGFAGSTGCLP